MYCTYDQDSILLIVSMWFGNEDQKQPEKDPVMSVCKRATVDTIETIW